MAFVANLSLLDISEEATGYQTPIRCTPDELMEDDHE